MNSLFDSNRAFVKDMLARPDNWDWSVQGFGMLRTYLDSGKRFRLNIWDSELAVPNVSLIHDHPWDFVSYVISGRFTNIRYFKDPNGDEYDWMIIRTGPGGGPEGADGTTRMLPSIRPEYYLPGNYYTQSAEEIHKSVFADGTVTLNDRIYRPDADHATVFWPHGEQWVDAEPRAATLDEVYRACERALSGFDA